MVVRRQRVNSGRFEFIMTVKVKVTGCEDVCPERKFMDRLEKPVASVFKVVGYTVS